MKNRPEFDQEKALYSTNPVFIYGLFDKFTAKIARIVYNLGFTANIITLLNLIIGLGAIAVLFLINGYWGLAISAGLVFLRNIGDTIDGKIARGSGMTSGLGGFSDIVSDWVFFHAAFF